MSFEGVVFLPRKMWYLPVLIDLGAAGLIAQDPHTGNFSPLCVSNGAKNAHRAPLAPSGSPEIRPELGFVTWGQFLSLGLDEY